MAVARLDEAEDVQDAQRCELCLGCVPCGAGGRSKGQVYKCKACLSMQSMLYRHLGPGALDGLTATDKQQFFHVRLWTA